jgi:hypothetical protein
MNISQAHKPETPSATYPVIDEPLLDQLEYLALGDHRVVHVQSAVLPLHRAIDVQRVAEPVVGASSRLEFLGTQRVGDVLDGVTEAVGVVVGLKWHNTQ